MIGLVEIHDLSGLLVGLLLSALVYAVVKVLLSLQEHIRLGSKFPCPPYHWLYGNHHLTDGTFGEKYLSMTRDVVEKHARAHTYWAGLFNVVVVTHPETIRQLLRSQSEKGSVYGSLRPWLGNGLFLSDGDQWRVHRRLLTPAFHFDILKQYVSVYNKEATEMISKLSETAKIRHAFEMFQEASMCTLEIILQCAFSGGQMSDETKNEYVAAIRKLKLLFVEMQFNPIYWLSVSAYNRLPSGREYIRLCKSIQDKAGSIITKRRQQQNRNGRPGQNTRLDFIDILLSARHEDGTGLTDLEIREEVDTFLFAGHETTASALSWTLYSLAQHPHHQDKVREEVNHLLSGREDDTIQWADLHKLPYLTMCLKEAMRLHTPVPMITRATLEDTVIDGVTVPKGFDIGIHLYGLHHNPAVWGPDHMEFDPSRFRPERMKDRDSHAFLPFSAGQRNCIGQNFAMNEAKVLLARLIHKFVFEVDPTRPAQKEMLIVMCAKGGMWMEVTPA
ncbi:cytochrome P450 4F6-like [Branchiostoma floridae]|uniref:Cytochrome P450 4F6-like n=1 Tax=Branchiostoma floridae TaxID=7739 RepID=A0A9J7M4I4_BRAFL|nr:cytochrome P450 4F6-like [Branchiostoma floridae]